MSGSHIYLPGRQILRPRRTKFRVELLEAEIFSALYEDHPQSVRHVYYCITNPRLPEYVEKTEKGYQQVQHRIAMMRKRGDLDYRWITDTTRRGYHVDVFDGSHDFITRVSHLYRADLWSASKHYVEVWTESRSMAGVVEADCRELAVSLYPSGGFSSMSLVWNAAQNIRESVEYGGKEDAHIIYIGDYDPAGVMIDRDIEAKLRSHLGGQVELHFHRLAINPDQIAAYDLPTKPRKEGERRRPEIERTVEAEAMPARVMRSLLRQRIESYLPPGALAAAKAAEQSEREGLLLFSRLLKKGGALSGKPDKTGDGV